MPSARAHMQHAYVIVILLDFNAQSCIHYIAAWYV